MNPLSLEPFVVASIRNTAGGCDINNISQVIRFPISRFVYSFLRFLFSWLPLSFSFFVHCGDSEVTYIYISIVTVNVLF
ncbi:MAG: hypothetical protein WCE21_05845 [Candidatus Babeliales bacterium]